MQLVGYAAAGTGVIFFGMGALASTIKRDLSFMGKFLFVGMIALLVAMIANMFLQIPALALTISTLVIVVFSLFLLYDLNRIMPRRRDQLRDGDDRRVHQPAQHLRQPAAPADGAGGRARLTIQPAPKKAPAGAFFIAGAQTERWIPRARCGETC